jgi:hypothetical protein
MSAPKRIQRRRTKGWRMPAETVYVGRPTRYGNPFSNRWFLRHHFDAAYSLRLYRQAASGGWDPQLASGLHEAARPHVYVAHCDWVRQFMGRHPTDMIRAELGGRDLACWCALDAPCHADILLEIANPPRLQGEPR